MAETFFLEDIPVVRGRNGDLYPATEAFMDWGQRVVESIGGLDGQVVIAADQVTSGTFINARISASSVTQHQGSFALSASQITSGTFDADRIPEPTITHETGTSYSLVGSIDIVTMDNALANTVTIPVGRTSSFEVWQVGAGATTVQGDSGVTVNGSDGGSDVIGTQWKHVKGVRLAANEWAVG